MAGIIIRQGENTLQAAASALVAEGFAEDAAASAATAEAASGPTYASTAAGLAATTSGEAFAVDAGGGLVSVYLNSSGTAVLQRSVYDGTAVKGFIDRFAFVDDASGDNVVINADVNLIASDLNTSIIAGGGNASARNLIGYYDYYTRIVGDGATNVFTSTFDVSSTTYVGVFLQRADGVRVQLEELSNIAIAVVGGKAQVTYPTSGNTNNGAGGATGSDPYVLTTENIIIVNRVANENLGSGCDYSGVFGSYDNTIQQGIMQHIVSHAHGRIVGGDHNLIVGGSYHRKENGSYGILAGGTNVIYSASGSGGGAFGSTNSNFSGTGPQWGFGASLTMSGAYSGAGGSDHVVSGNGAWAFGRDNTVSGRDSFVVGTENTVAGLYAFGAGQGNTVSGTYAAGVGRLVTASGESSFAGGREATASATYTFSHGYQTNVSGTSSAAFGYQTTYSGTYGIVAGRSNSVSGSYSAAFGRNNTVTADWALTVGYSASNPNDFSVCIGGESFAAVGDCQTTTLVLRRQTIDATPTELRSGAATARLTIPDQTTWAFSILIVARRTDADGESAGYKLEGVLDRNTGAASTALVGTVVKTVVGEDTAAWDVSAAADTTNGALSITVTGEASKTIRWVARVDLAEVSG